MSKNSNAKRIGYFLERTTRIVKLSYLKAMKENGIDLTPEQWVILDNLYENNGQSQKDLANGSFKNAPTISRILDLLGQKGHIKRNTSTDDRRKFKIFLTKDGKNIVEQSQAIIKEMRERGWQDLSDEDYADFTRILNQIFKNYE
jgi:DNA-binding MarR family transcriptional regulator